MAIKTLGIDLAKNTFHLIGMDTKGNVVMKKQLTRKKLEPFIANVPPCLIGMEACGGSNYWARLFASYGHEVKLMNPQYVKPYVKTNKNDFNDAEAICEAVQRPTMRFVAPKSIEQQDIQALHRVRQRVISERTALANQIRGLLSEYGHIIPQGIRYVHKYLPLLLSDEENQNLSALGRKLLNNLYEELRQLDKRVKELDAEIEAICKASEICQRLIQVPGVGPLTATALVAAVGDAKEFENGRQMSAYFGLVPGQHSSGGKTVLGRMSKRGDRYLRTLLIHGARAATTNMARRPEWLKGVIARAGKYKAYVALANKNARVLWALLAKEQDYQPAF